MRKKPKAEEENPGSLVFNPFVQGAAGAVAGFGVGELAKVMRNRIDFKEEKSDWEKALLVIPHHYQLGQVAVMSGVGLGNPALVGVGGGLIVSDLKDFLNQEPRTAPVMFSDADLGDDWYVQNFDIPNWLPKPVIYWWIGRKLSDIVTKPTWNAKKREWIPAGREHPAVLKTLREIIHSKEIDGHDLPAVLQGIQEWTQDNVQWVNDPRSRDMYFHPYRTLQVMSGDCDCHSLLTASLGEAASIPMSFIMIGQHSPTMFNHILSAGRINGKLVPIETTRLVKIGYIPKHIHKKVVHIPL